MKHFVPTFQPLQDSTPYTYILLILLLSLYIIMNNCNNVSKSPFTSPNRILLFPYTRIGFLHLSMIYVQPSCRGYGIHDSFILSTLVRSSRSHV